MRGSRRLLAAVLALVSCALPARAGIVVAVAGPMTGKYAAMGEQMRRGAGQAVDNLNAGGGVLGERLRAGGYEPEAYTLYTYAAIQAWAAAAKRAGTVRADSVAPALRAQPVETVLGPLSFTHTGDVTAPGYVPYRWTQGTYGEVR